MAPVNTECEPPVVPSEVLAAYDISPGTVRKIGGGMINLTCMWADQDGNQAILQKLHDMFSEAVVEDAAVVTAHLSRGGWETPQAVLTTDNKVHVRDEQSRLWRATKYINNQPPPETVSREIYAQAGQLLGQLHSSLRTIDYTPKFVIPHFHDTPYYARQLEQVSLWLPSDEARAMATEVLSDYKNLAELPDMGTQLIHGDPRVNNMLFREGKPFTFIDYDTLMLGSVWLDIGDLLRSLGEESARRNADISKEDLRDIADAYRIASGIEIGSNRFFVYSLEAGKTIALELTMRFLSDIAEPYFEYDTDVYSSRLEFDLERAGLQRQVYENLCQAAVGDED